MIEITFPRRFPIDCLECECDVGIEVAMTRKSIRLAMTDEQIAEFRSRARHYAGDAIDGPDLAGLRLSARRCLQVLDEALAAAAERAEVARRGEVGGVADLEAYARTQPLGSARRDFTSLDFLTVQYRPRWSPEFEYRHNGVRIERDRAVELIGERL